ncbi:MAG TPA: DUF4446 family protein [Candidatus Pacearchaeota archaeon]|nr:DUF4446 family protein [Candidatus Parcubacteria bacterium]HNZ83810.1 DUF4446 family protein [Candidatus Pacearchaeota archaeon]HPM08769.1 DUF4446 family protein [Candidatus Pacearchaeota archaeon]
MSNQIIFYIISFIILAVNAYIIFYTYKLNKRIGLFFEKGGNDLEQTLKNILNQLESFKKYNEINDQNIKDLQEIAQRSFQKCGIVRFSPFKDVGGKQSFCISMLDKNNSGFLITSHFGRDFNHIYVKPISKGKSEYSLSKEEQKALDKSIGIDSKDQEDE